MESRTLNATRNIVTGLLNKFASIVMPFIVRTVVIHTLGINYLGLDNLFSAILQVLNLSELGISSAIAYCMYRPIAERNTEKVEALYLYVKRAYQFIGMFILFAGIITTPCLKLFIKGKVPSGINIYFLYLVYIINSGISYCMFAYKSVLLNAYQRLDIGNSVLTISRMVTYILQLIILILTKNYYLFIIILPLGTIINNILLSHYVEKLFPDIRTKGKLDNETKRMVKHQILGVCINKLCLTSRNSLDSILISTYLGLSMTAIYNNYYYILNALVSIVLIVSSSIIPGIGNSIATENIEKNYKDFRKFNFLFMWLSVIFTSCLFVLYQPFMKVWMGEKYCLPSSSVLLFTIYFFSMMLGNIKAVYTEAAGLWWENKNRAIFEVILNVLLNIFLGKIFGINGIIIATVITIITVNFGLSSLVLFNSYFKYISSKEFFRDSVTYFVVMAIICSISFFTSSKVITSSLLMEIFIKLVLCIMISNCIFVLIYRNTLLYKESVIWIKEKVNIWKK